MKEKLIEQIGKELKLATRVDLVTMVIGVLVTLLFFAIAAGSAAKAVGEMMPNLGGGMFGGALAIPNNDFNVAPVIIMFVTLIAIAVINCYAIKFLRNNKAQRAKANEGLVKFLKDEAVDQYNDGSIFKTYEARYSLFTMIMGSVAALSIIVPLVIFIDKLTQL